MNSKLCPCSPRSSSRKDPAASLVLFLHRPIPFSRFNSPITSMTPSSTTREYAPLTAASSPPMTTRSPPIRYPTSERYAAASAIVAPAIVLMSSSYPDPRYPQSHSVDRMYAAFVHAGYSRRFDSAHDSS